MKPRNELANDYHNRLPEGPFQKSFVHGAFVDGYDAGYQAAQQWISVKERLPEDGHDLSIMLVWRSIEHDYDTVRWRYQQGWDCVVQDKSTITHWMPLPKPPEDK